MSKRLEQLARERKALQLKRAGASYDTIARECGYQSKSGAWEAVKRALAASVPDEAAEDVRRLELSRLDAITTALWPKVVKGDLPAIDRALKVSAARLELLARTAPTAAPAEPEQTGDPVVDLEARRARRRAGA